MTVAHVRTVAVVVRAGLVVEVDGIAVIAVAAVDVVAWPPDFV